MKYGCCTTMENYDILQNLGYDYIELSGSLIYSLPERELDKIAQIISDGTVKCCGFNAAISKEIAIVGPNFDVKSARNYCKELCRRGSILNIASIGVGSPNSRKIPEGFDKSLADEQAKEFYNILLDEAAPYHIFILWESLNPLEANYGISMTEGAKMVAEINRDYSGIICDLYHMSVCGEGLKEVEETISQIRHVHVSQWVGRERRYLSQEYYEFYDKILSYLIKHGYNRIISTEAFDGDFVSGAKNSLDILKRIEKSSLSKL